MNYHRHSQYTNIFVPDSVELNKNYAKRVIEVGHKGICSMEHGWQGNYFETHELAKKYNLKHIVGAEAYWVKDRKEKDKTNAHICILAMNEDGRMELNDVLAEANISGFSRVPRLDLELIFSLNPKNVIITSACVGFWKYKEDEIVKKMKMHFQDNFFLEVQYHLTQKQKELNEHILQLSSQYNIPLIAGYDSHYINSKTAWERTDYLISKGIKYPEEEGWFLDYPDDEVAFKRFKDQNILTDKQIEEAFDSTQKLLDVQEYDMSLFDEEIKMPTIYPEWTQEDKNNEVKRILNQEWKKQRGSIPKEEWGSYIGEIKKETKAIFDTAHSDYFLLNYKIIDEAIKKGGLITESGRGSAISHFTNKLFNFTKIDRMKVPVPIIPERFMSATRMNLAKNLADIDFNVANPEIFVQVQKDIMGEDHAYPMIAFGTYQPKAAWKMYAKAKNVDFEISNHISNQIEQYTKDMKYADEDMREQIELLDYIDEEYHELMEDSKEYLGIVSDKKPHPCAHLLFNGNIRKKIGLIKASAESSKKKVICCIMDGNSSEKYKYLKNDWLKVNVIKLNKMIFKRLNLKEMEATELYEKCKGNSKVWDIYKNGFTMGINQVEVEKTRRKVKKYAPKNFSELCNFIAAIRPAFKSMYKIFEDREDFSYNIPILDSLIQTEEMPYSFILFQETIMLILAFAGIEMDITYNVIKAISKKRYEKIMAQKDKFIKGFEEKVKKEGNSNGHEVALKVWEIIENSAEYLFNSAHSACVATDSLYGAYLKSHYTIYFYECFFNLLVELKQKNRLALARKEALDMNIILPKIKFRQDNRRHTANEEDNFVMNDMQSIKGMSASCGELFYKLKDGQYKYFVDLLQDVPASECNAGHLRALIKLNYFEEFGTDKKLYTIYEYFTKIYGKKQLSKVKAQEFRISEETMLKFSRETSKTYMDLDVLGLLYHIEDKCGSLKFTPQEHLKAELEYLGYLETRFKEYEDYIFVTELNTKYTPKIQAYDLKTGKYETYKIYKNDFYANPISEHDICKIVNFELRNKRRKVEDKWIELDEKEKILKSYHIC